MKTCSKCNIEKPLEDFNKNASKKDGLQSFCRDCSRKSYTDYYKENQKQVRENITRRKAEYKAKAYRFLDKVKSWGCIICDENEPCCIDFHHLDPDEKDDSVSNLVAKGGASLSRIKDEVRKCVRLCANCHRKVHKGLIDLDEIAFLRK